MLVAASLEDPARLADLIASNLELKLEEAQRILELVAPVERLKAVLEILRREIVPRPLSFWPDTHVESICGGGRLAGRQAHDIPLRVSR